MLFVKYLLMTGGVGMILAAAGILLHDLYRQSQRGRRPEVEGQAPEPAPQVHWRSTVALAMLAWCLFSEVMAILSRTNNKGVVIQERERIGSQPVQLGIF